MDNIVEIKNVYKSYGKKEVLIDLNVSIPKGKYRILVVFMNTVDFFIRAFIITVYIREEIRCCVSMIQSGIKIF